MVRVVHDYPELIGRIGNMTEITGLKEITIMMAAGPVFDQKGNQASLYYNSKFDKKNLWGILFRSLARTDDASYTGVHELGHVLASLAMDESSGKDVWQNHVQEGKFVDEALNQEEVMSPQERQRLVRHNHTRNNHQTGQINLNKSKLDKKGHTTWYGVTNAGEFFAEAFADVYQNGKKARKASIAILKAYERKAKKMVIIRQLRRLDYAWLLHQLDPGKYSYTDIDDRERQKINEIYKKEVDFMFDNPDLHPRFGEIIEAREDIRENDRAKFNEWTKNMDVWLNDLQKTYGSNNSIYTNDRTELRVMEFVEAIENGEKIVFQLSASTREKLRPSILDRALKAQKTVDEYIKNKKKKGKSK